MLHYPPPCFCRQFQESACSITIVDVSALVGRLQLTNDSLTTPAFHTSQPGPPTLQVKGQGQCHLSRRPMMQIQEQHVIVKKTPQECETALSRIRCLLAPTGARIVTVVYYILLQETPCPLVCWTVRPLVRPSVEKYRI